MSNVPRKYNENGEIFDFAVATGYLGSDNCWQVGSGLDWLSCCRELANVAGTLTCRHQHWRSWASRSRLWVRRRTKLPREGAHVSQCRRQQILCWRLPRDPLSCGATQTCLQCHWRNCRNCRREASCVSAKSKPKIKTAEKPHSSCCCCSSLFCICLNQSYLFLFAHGVFPSVYITLTPQWPLLLCLTPRME